MAEPPSGMGPLHDRRDADVQPERGIFHTLDETVPMHNEIHDHVGITDRLALEVPSPNGKF